MTDVVPQRLGLTFTPEAKTTISRMGDRTNQIGAAFGFGSKAYLDATVSLARCLVSMIGLGGSVQKEVMSELSLYCANEFITYGVNWSPARPPKGYEGLGVDDLCGTWSVNS